MNRYYMTFMAMILDRDALPHGKLAVVLKHNATAENEQEARRKAIADAQASGHQVCRFLSIRIRPIHSF